MKPTIFVGCLLLLLGCSVKRKDPKPDRQTYRITENFEGARKDAYAKADYRLRTGLWEFDDALIWGAANQADAKVGERAVRIRNNGSISTAFDVANLHMVYLKHGLFGSDTSATWRLYIAPNGQNFRQVGNEMTTVSHTLKLDSFAVTDTGKVRLRIVKTGGGRLNLDDILFKGAGDSGIALGEPAEGDGGIEPEPYPPRGVERGDDAPAPSGDNSNLLFGNPSNATDDVMDYTNYLIDHSYFILSYNRDRGTPNWVSWHLGEANITEAVSRQNNFAAYIGLPENWYAVSHASYTASGFDRGHNCPSADRTSSYAANAATFLMTNMIPQAPANNGGPWAGLESHIREQVRNGYEAYVIMGSYGRGGKGSQGEATTLAGGKITVPARIWKVALFLRNGDDDLARVTTQTKIIAVDMPNTNDVADDWKAYRVSVDDIEQQTGYDLFTSLPEATQRILEEAVVVGF
ncbi:DNA/RNA non-specific endonuclease [Parapedobacter sp. 10938]|uniref:DNA/RNA non-specific endonuclease n=1 Tax=Parapedobacter flavus TaxID=3110225 RepID=UPI002DBEE5C4|nr:DNA/RNA non-specific endonuclease [Parapedobacter sp. 10938]MEC3879845.1 DNA/RNA non-specific endonuclease [Parapedobacter sp. 10938]